MSDLLSSASLLLAILAVLYGLWYPEITRAIQIEIPKHKENYTKPYNAVRPILRGRAVPLTIAAFVLTLVFLPPAATIAWRSVKAYYDLGVWGNITNYDAVLTAFVLVELLSLWLAIHLLRLTLTLNGIVRTLRPI